MGLGAQKLHASLIFDNPGIRDIGCLRVVVTVKSKRLLLLVYDGIANSVFESLVLLPALKKVEIGLFSHVDIVLFESAYEAAHERVQKLQAQSRAISFHIIRRLPVIGKISVGILAPVLGRWLLDNWYDEILVRGPLAAYLLSCAISWFVLPLKPGWRVPIAVQIRGLAAEEIRLSYHVEKRTGFLKRCLFLLKFKTLEAIELSVYRANSWPVPVKMYAVSSALQDYVVQHFGGDAEQISIETADLIESVSPALVLEWRAELRGFLKIPQSAVVYGYSGSCKRWQCAQETVEYIIARLAENPETFGLILTTDVLEFEKIIETFSFDRSRLLLKLVQPKDVLRWTAVFDYGILLRYQDIVNWVSRPTKALEYQAVGLKIIHNNTVKWLIDYEKTVGAGGREMTPHPRQVSLS